MHWELATRWVNDSQQAGRCCYEMPTTPPSSTFVIMRGTRSEPVEATCEASSLADRFVVFIDGKRTVFENADAYVRWAEGTLQEPYAPKLVARMRIAPSVHRYNAASDGDEDMDDDDGQFDDPMDDDDDCDNDGFFDDRGAHVSSNWGDVDDDD